MAVGAGQRTGVRSVAVHPRQRDRNSEGQTAPFAAANKMTGMSLTRNDQDGNYKALTPPKDTNGTGTHGRRTFSDGQMRRPEPSVR